MKIYEEWVLLNSSCFCWWNVTTNPLAIRVFRPSGQAAQWCLRVSHGAKDPAVFLEFGLGGISWCRNCRLDSWLAILDNRICLLIISPINQSSTLYSVFYCTIMYDNVLHCIIMNYCCMYHYVYMGMWVPTAGECPKPFSWNWKIESLGHPSFETVPCIYHSIHILFAGHRPGPLAQPPTHKGMTFWVLSTAQLFHPWIYSCIGILRRGLAPERKSERGIEVEASIFWGTHNCYFGVYRIAGSWLAAIAALQGKFSLPLCHGMPSIEAWTNIITRCALAICFMCLLTPHSMVPKDV